MCPTFYRPCGPEDALDALIIQIMTADGVQRALRFSGPHLRTTLWHNDLTIRTVVELNVPNASRILLQQQKECPNKFVLTTTLQNINSISPLLKLARSTSGLPVEVGGQAEQYIHMTGAETPTADPEP